MSLLKTPPFSEEAELSVIGGLMLEPDAWDVVSDILNADDFYKPVYKLIYQAMFELHRVGNPVDLVTLSDHLSSRNLLDGIGGTRILAEVVNQTPSAANIGSYAQIISEKSTLRRMIQVNSQIIEQAYQQSFESIDSFLNSAEAQIFSVSQQKRSAGLESSGQIVKRSLRQIEELSKRQSDVTGVPSGFIELDQLTSGFHSGELTIIAARPSMGKTALSLNIAQHVAVNEKRPVAYFSLEMTQEQVMMRILASIAKIHLSQLRVGSIPNNRWPDLINTAAKVSEAPLFIDDTSSISPYEIRARCRRLKTQHDLALIVIDYLQIMDLKHRVESRERAVAEISRSLKALAKELQVPVVALAQLNRGVESRGERKPQLSDIRESGSLEQDADLIMMIYREEYYDRDNPDIKGIGEILINKHRNGPTGNIKLRWHSNFGLFENYDPQSDQSPPPPTPTPLIRKPPNFAPHLIHTTST